MGREIRLIVEGHIARKRASGYSYDEGTERKYLQLADFLEERHVPGEPIITKEKAEEWVSLKEGESSSTAHTRAIFIRQLAIYMIRMGYEDCYLLPTALIPEEDNDFVPYVFTHGEIEAVTDSFDGMRPHHTSPSGYVVYPNLFRTIYGCGLRSGEGVRLEVRDVDLGEGVLRIRRTKNDDSRYVPMSESLVKCLTGYADEMGSALSSPDTPFFPSPSGGFYALASVEEMFRKRFSEAGVLNQEGRPPRIYDLRHTFAVHSLQAAGERGIPEHVFLPALAVYMGHRDISHTEHYLHLTLEGQARAVAALDAAYGDMFPEVTALGW